MIPRMHSRVPALIYVRGRRMMTMTDEDLNALRAAVQLLENPSLAARLANILGKPIELIGLALPASAAKIVSAATSKALDAALQVALRTMQNKPEAGSHLLHKVLAT